MIKIEPFGLFWENSKLNKHNIGKLVKNIEIDARTYGDSARLEYPSEDLKLVAPYGKLARIIRRRKSERNFSQKAITERQLGSLFYSFAQKKDGTRMVPSAGGKYPIEVFAFLFTVKSRISGSVVYYNADNHTLSVIGKCPEWKSSKYCFSDNLNSMPSVFFVFAAFANRSMKKYGERGGRFVMIEAGQYVQNLSLMAESEGVCGVEIGSLYDEEIKKLLGIEKTDATICIGYACGNKV